MVIASRVWLLFALAFMPVLPQQPVRALSRVEGIVVASNGDPLADVRVVLRPEAPLRVNDQINSAIPVYITITDSRGRFVLRDIAAGRYRLGASLRGYLDTEYGQSRPRRPGAVLDLTTIQELRDLSIRLTVGGVVTGRVYAANGRPFQGARVQGTVTDERGRPSIGARVVLVPSIDRFDLYSVATTDQSGRFNIAAVAPGDYKVFAWADVEDFAYFDPDFLQRVPPQSSAQRSAIRNQHRSLSV